ncbi:MAG: RNase adapter RapZ [Gammaproteobacteria bacterium]|nr:RNase adapter RapZ [Gammaproteobacteria bacterium]
MKCYVISGRSGSGKSTMLRSLEDFGFNCVDNLPTSMLPSLVQHASNAVPTQHIAVCIDIRNSLPELEQFPSVYQQLKKQGIEISLIYMDALSAVLVKRFSDTRRRHPLDKTGMDLRQAMDEETKVLENIASMADLKIDSTNLSTHDLVLQTKERLVEKADPGISLLFRSFGFRYGVPVDADLVFDARCLPNPHWEEHLRPLTGRDQPVVEYLDSQPLVNEFFTDVSDFLQKWIPIFSSQHRVYFTVAIGCTGGKHRSVYLAERLGRAFNAQYPGLLVRHREPIKE